MIDPNDIIKLLELVESYKESCMAQVINAMHSSKLNNNMISMQVCYEAQMTADLFKVYIANRSANIKPMIKLLEENTNEVIKHTQHLCNSKSDTKDTSKTVCTIALKLKNELKKFNKLFEN